MYLQVSLVPRITVSVNIILIILVMNKLRLFLEGQTDTGTSSDELRHSKHWESIEWSLTSVILEQRKLRI